MWLPLFSYNQGSTKEEIYQPCLHLSLTDFPFFPGIVNFASLICSSLKHLTRKLPLLIETSHTLITSDVTISIALFEIPGGGIKEYGFEGKTSFRLLISPNGPFFPIISIVIMVEYH